MFSASQRSGCGLLSQWWGSKGIMLVVWEGKSSGEDALHSSSELLVPLCSWCSKRLQRMQRKMQEPLFFLLLYRREADEKYDFFCTSRERSSLRPSATSWRKQGFLIICLMGLLAFLVPNSMHPGEELGCIVQRGALQQRGSL